MSLLQTREKHVITLSLITNIMNIHIRDNVLSDYSDGKASRRCTPKAVVKIATPFEGRLLDATPPQCR